MTRRIEQQPAPREARGVVNRHPRNRGVFRAILNQLEQRFHRPQRAKARVSGDVHTARIHGEFVALIAVRQRLRLHFFGDGH
ncbi:hypothetical protein D3C72_1190260 [compost metagenome]